LPGGYGAETCRSDVDDTLADFSNFGPDVEIAAPGVCIFSTDLDDGYSVKSGTSMASPAVAGAVARLIAENGLPTDNRADVEAIKATVIGAGMPQASSCGFTDVDSSPEPLLFVNGPAFGGDGTCEEGPATNSAPTADFSYVCSDLSCSFTDLSFDLDGTISAHSWDFGDTTTSTEASPSHSFLAAGTYQVSLTVSDDAGDSSTTAQDVTVTASVPVNQPPVASFSSSCTDLDCSFTNTSSDPDPGDTLTYSWTFGDGGSSTAQSPSHTYPASGTYQVDLTVSDGTDSDTATEFVSVTDPPPAPTVVTAGVNPIMVDGRDAEIPLMIFDDGGDFVHGATVEGVWTYLDRRGRERTATASEVSSADFLAANPFGNVVFTRRFPRGSTVVSFCLTNITAAGHTYLPPPILCGYPFP
jgi:PKD repeat protein